MPMSPRNPPSALQGPGTPISHTHALPPVHPSHPPPALSHASNSIGGLTSPTPSSASIPRLNAGSNAFAFVPRAKVTLKKEDSTEVNLENFAAKSIPAPVPSTTATPSPQGSVYRQGSPGTPTRRPASIRIESEDQRKKRLAEEEQREKESQRIKVEAEEKTRTEKEEIEREIKEAEKKRQVDKAEKKRRKREEQSLKKQHLQKEDAATKKAATGPLATAKIIADINTVQYPEGVKSPHPELNQNAKEGKFRYDRDFLLQFTSLCKEKPAMLPPLDAIGLDPVDQHMSRGGSGGAPPSPQNSVGLGFSPGTFNGKPTNPFNMGNFATPRANKLSSEDRFAMSTSARAASVSRASGMQFTDGREQKATRSPPIITKEEKTFSNTLERPHPETYSQWYPPMSLQLPLGFSQDGADPNESQAHAGSTVSDAFGIPSKDGKDSDIAIIKRHIRSLVRKIKEEQDVGGDTQELAPNRLNSISVMDEEGKKIIAIINLLVNADETT